MAEHDDLLGAEGRGGHQLPQPRVVGGGQGGEVLAVHAGEHLEYADFFKGWVRP